MSDNKNTATALDDERRVKVLSPGQLVAKRFFRNRLALCRRGLQQQFHFPVCRRTGASGGGTAEIYPGSQ